jgi:hypothetical protein
MQSDSKESQKYYVLVDYIHELDYIGVHNQSSQRFHQMNDKYDFGAAGMNVN